jgi:diguanylate cyclase (GGDEF)-like protein
MIGTVDRFLSRLRPAQVTALATVALACVGVLDFVTGYELSFSVFYVAPVAIATWYAGRRAGFAFALAASVVWYVVELAGAFDYGHPAIPIWNAGVRLGFFLIIAALLAELGRRLASERQLARTDALTGLSNSRAFAEQIERDLALADRAGRPLALAYVDLDDFKQVNDTHGHGEGDRLLCAIARTLTSAMRRSDTVARLGGDEFALILPSTDLDGAEVLIAKLAGMLREAVVPDLGAVTCSIGVVVFRELPDSAGAAIAAADRLMYEAKTQGKNAVAYAIYSQSRIESVRPEAPVPAA